VKASFRCGGDLQVRLRRQGRCELFRSRVEYSTAAFAGIRHARPARRDHVNSITPVMIVRSPVSCTAWRLSASVYRFVMTEVASMTPRSISFT